MELKQLLIAAVDRNASDIHLIVGQPPVLRVRGKLERLSELGNLDAAVLDGLVREPLSESTRNALADNTVSSVEAMVASDGVPSVNFSLCAYKTDTGMAATLRAISSAIPPLDAIAFDVQPLLQQIVDLRRGLVLFTGPTGSGKLTTAASVVETINTTRAERIFVLEDVAGYTYESKQSVISALHIGREYESYERAAQIVFRGADPDVILFSDLPTQEAARQALLLAETGHLVLAVLNAEGTADAIANLVHALPEPRDGARELLVKRRLEVSR